VADTWTSDELLARLTEHTPVGVFVSDAQGGCVYVNQRWSELSGLDASEAYGDGWIRALHPDDVARVQDEWSESAVEGRDSIIEYRFRRPDGSVRWIRGFASAMRNGDGAVRGWVGSCLDVTDRVGRERQQKAIVELGLLALSEAKVDQLLHHAVGLVARELEVDYASFLALEPGGSAAVLRAGYGWHEPLEPVVAPLADSSPAARALQSAEPILVEHTLEPVDDRGDLLRSHGVASSAAVVVGAGLAEPFGVLSGHSRDAGAFSQSDLHFLGGVAHVLAAALTRADSDARGRAVLDSTLDAVVTVDHAGRILEFNAAAEQMFGYRADEVVGRKLGDCLVPPSLRERHVRGFERAIASGEAPLLGKRREFLGLRADGTEFPIELSVTKVALDGSPVFTGFIRDLTDDKQAEQTRLQLAAIVESSADAIFGKTLDGVVTSWNAAAEDIYGYSAEEALGRSIEFIIPPERRGELSSLLDRLRRGEHVAAFETVRLHKDGSRIEVALTLSPILDASGRPVGASVIGRDIGERKRAEAELSSSEARYRGLFDNASDLIAVVDLESRLVDVNLAFERALGYSRDELIGHKLQEFVPTEFHEMLGDARRDKLDGRRASTVYEHDLETRDGDRIHVEVATRLLFEGGLPVATEAICRDVTERRRLEDELRQAQKMEAIGNLAGGIAHDFNNLLLLIRTCAELALAKVDDDAVRGDIREIERAAQRATELTRQLLAFGRRQVLQPQVTDIDVQIADMLQLLQRTLGENISIDHRPGDHIPAVLADRGQLSQVVVNLAINARDAMPAGGTVTIRTKDVVVESDMRGRPHDAPPGRYVLLQISDTGVGIAADTQASIFDPFFTTKEQGTGLGLATVYGVVKQSHGFILVDSAPRAGAVFSIYLPALEAPAAGEDQPRLSPAKLQGGEIVLLVEDEDTIRPRIAEVLRGFGYTVFEARDGDEALSLLATAGGQVDLLFSDVVMPGMNGSELAQLIRSRHPHIRLLLTSGYPADATLPTDASYIQKPYLPSELAAAVRATLDGVPHIAA
jgi:two-component system, cell cycle sensor histidine kinase and response regulator CckA